MGSKVWAIGALLVVGCGGSSLSIEPPEEARSVVLVTIGTGDDVTRAASLDDPIRESVDGEADISLLFYDESLETLGVAAGELDPRVNPCALLSPDFVYRAATGRELELSAATAEVLDAIVPERATRCAPCIKLLPRAIDLRTAAPEATRVSGGFWPDGGLPHIITAEGVLVRVDANGASQVPGCGPFEAPITSHFLGTDLWIGHREPKLTHIRFSDESCTVLSSSAAEARPPRDEPRNISGSVEELLIRSSNGIFRRKTPTSFEIIGTMGLRPSHQESGFSNQGGVALLSPGRGLLSAGSGALGFWTDGVGIREEDLGLPAFDLGVSRLVSAGPGRAAIGTEAGNLFLYEEGAVVRKIAAVGGSRVAAVAEFENGFLLSVRGRIIQWTASSGLCPPIDLGTASEFGLMWVGESAILLARDDRHEVLWLDVER